MANIVNLKIIYELNFLNLFNEKIQLYSLFYEIYYEYRYWEIKNQ